MTATTDYPRMATLLRWALEVSGNGKYREALEARLAETRMESREIAETLPEDRMRLSLQLPDTEAMQDPNWLLTIYQVNTEKLGTLLLSALDLAASLLDDSRAPQNSLFSEHTSWVSGGENRMEAVVMRQPSLCLLFNLDPETEELRGLSLLAGGEWVDLLPAQEGEEAGDLLALLLNSLYALDKLGKPKELSIPSYLAARRFVIDEMLSYTHCYPYVDGLILRTTRSICNVPVTHRAREDGESGYTLVKLIGLWMNGFTSFSVKPLRIASYCGAAAAASARGAGAVAGTANGLPRWTGASSVPPFSAAERDESRRSLSRREAIVFTTIASRNTTPSAPATIGTLSPSMRAASLSIIAMLLVRAGPPARPRAPCPPRLRPRVRA